MYFLNWYYKFVLPVSRILKTPSFTWLLSVVVYWLENCILKHLSQQCSTCAWNFCTGVGKKHVMFWFPIIPENVPLTSYRFAWLLAELVAMNCWSLLTKISSDVTLHCIIDPGYVILKYLCMISSLFVIVVFSAYVECVGLSAMVFVTQQFTAADMFSLFG